MGINWEEMFQKKSRVRPLWSQNECINFGKFASRISWRDTKKIQIKLAMTCNKNEQHDAKNNADQIDKDDSEELWRDY